MASDMGKMLMIIVGGLFVVIMVILALPYVAATGIVSSDTSTMLISTSTGLNDLIMFFTIILICGALAVVVEGRR